MFVTGCRFDTAFDAAGKMPGDRLVVGRRHLEGFGGQAETGLRIDRLAIFEEVSHEVIVVRIGDHDHRAVVLGRRPDEGRAADVDLLDRGLRGEEVEIDDHHIEDLDVVRRQRLHVFRIALVGDDASEDVGMERADPPIEHLREAGDMLDEGSFQTGVPESFGGPTGGHQGAADMGESCGEGYETGLVGDREEDSEWLFHRYDGRGWFQRGRRMRSAYNTTHLSKVGKGSLIDCHFVAEAYNIPVG